ncbi:hypothetical protein AMD00_01475 [Viridibacillus arvi]|uniref:Uncharacterized protein n=1 Tax=Viridibacillus arvi TaxID=263475 RepID=A0A0M0LJE9_9BACL|nr:hypothetical protein AMD00_01475 [Viridibacillus arvi]
MEIQGDYKAAERTLFNTISLANEVEDNQVITIYVHYVLKKEKSTKHTYLVKKHLNLQEKCKIIILPLNLQFI